MKYIVTCGNKQLINCLTAKQYSTRKSLTKTQIKKLIFAYLKEQKLTYTSKRVS